MRPLFHLVARQKSSELFVLFVLLVTLGLAWVTELAGLSLALGAFLAGMLISETEYRYQVEDYIKPFRDVLLGLFFVTIGMLLDVRALARALRRGRGACSRLLLVVKFARDLRARARLRQREAHGAARGAGARARGRVRLRAARARRSATSALDADDAAGRARRRAALDARRRRSSSRAWSAIVLHFVESEWTQRAVALHNARGEGDGARKGHVIVCGYGRSGQALAQFLEREKVAGDRARLRSRARAPGGGGRRLGGLRRRVAARGAGGRGARRARPPWW